MRWMASTLGFALLRTGLEKEAVLGEEGGVVEEDLVAEEEEEVFGALGFESPFH